VPPTETKILLLPKLDLPIIHSTIVLVFICCNIILEFCPLRFQVQGMFPQT